MNKDDLALLLVVLAGIGASLAAEHSANKERRQARGDETGGVPNPRHRQARAAAKRLEERGLIRNAGNTLVPQRDAVTLLLKRASERHSLGVILRGSNERVFCSLAEPGTVTDIVGRTGLSVPTIYRALRDLYSVGAARSRDGMICVDSSLTDLAKAMRVVSEGTDVHAHTIYKDSQRTLVSVPAKSARGGQPTAFSRFGEFGVEYHTVRDYYTEQESGVDIHDILVHALLAAAEYRDKNGMSMVLVFYLKHRSRMDTTRIRHVASRFGVAGMWLDVESYVRSRAAVKNAALFPPWEEFVEKARLYGVDPAEYSMPPPAEGLLHDVGERLQRPVSIYLLGGENMRLKGLKNSTKDCDIVVKDGRDFGLVVGALTAMGYLPIAPAEHAADDGRLYPDDILKHPVLPRMDIFTKRVMGGITLTDSMIDSADHISFGNLNVGLLRNEHVFLLKAVAGRDGDIQDMAAIVRGSGQPSMYNRHEFDWTVVLDEAMRQDLANPTMGMYRMLFGGLSYMEEQTGIKSPIMPRIRLLAVDSYIEWLARGGWRRPHDIAGMLAGGDISHSYVRNRIRALAKAGTLETKRIGRLVLVYNDARFPHPKQEADRRGVDEYMLWRFHPEGTYDAAALMQRANDSGCGTLGELDYAIRRKIRDA